jgi:hypothetical protein
MWFPDCLETGNKEYTEIESFMLISKMQTCHSDKMLPKKENKKIENIGTSFCLSKRLFNFHISGAFWH